MEAANFHHEAFLDTAGRAQSGRSLELHLAALSALCSDSCVLVRCCALPELGEGSDCASLHLALPDKRLPSSGRAGRPALPHGQRSLPPPPTAIRGCWLQPGECTCLSASLLPDRPALHTSASVQSCWGGPWASAIPHPLQTLLLNNYNSCKSKQIQCARFMWVASALSAKEAPTWGLCCCTMFLKTTVQKCSSLIRSCSSLAISSCLLSTKLCHI